MYYKQGEFDHTERIENYIRYELIRLGKHEEAFKKYIEQAGSTYRRDINQGYPSLFYVINIAKEISRVSADMLFGEIPKITVEDSNQQEWLDNAIEKIGLFKTLYEGADFGSAKGDSVFRITLKDGELSVAPINPGVYFPEINPHNVSEIPERVEIRQPIKIEDVSYILITTYEGGDISYRVVDKHGDPYPESASYLQEQGLEDASIKIDENSELVFHVKNSGVPTMFFGESDYNDLELLFYSIDNRFSRINSILDKHSSPILEVDQKIFTSIREGGGFVPSLVSLGDGFDNQDNPVSSRYVVWDGKLQDSFEQLSRAIDMVLMISEISPSLVGKDMAGGAAESGRALKYRLIRTLAMKSRKEMYWGSMIKKLLWSLQDVSFQNKWTVAGKVSGEPLKVSVEWQDGIINDTIEQMEIVERQLANGLISEEDAIVQINGIDKDQAEKRLAEIQEKRARRSIFFTPPEDTIEEE